jgi:ERCC4-type nuclease
MIIVLDKREKELLKYCNEALSKQSDETKQKISIIQEELLIGDVLIQTEEKITLLIIERKTFTDLLASIKDGRYEEQSHRLINTSGLPTHSIMYLLEGMFSQVNEKDKKIIFSCMASLNYFKGFSVLRTSTINETGEYIIAFTDKIVRDLEKGKVNQNTEQENYCNYVKKVKKENITPENIGEIILSQIPGISTVTAIAIMKKFSTFPKFIIELQTNPDCLNDITSDTNGKIRKINKNSIENIKKYLSN